MIKLISILSITLFSVNSIAQNKNKLQINTDMMLISNFVYAEDFSQWGFSYSRQISKNSLLSIGLSKWTTSDDFFLPEREGVLYSECYIYSDYEDCVKELIARKFYKRINASYDFYLMPYNKYGEILLSAGISYTRGVNVYLDSIITPTQPPFDNYEGFYKQEVKGYIGLFPKFEYNYKLFKNRFLVGLHFMPQKYFGLKSIQLDIGIHLGVMF